MKKYRKQSRSNYDWIKWAKEVISTYIEGGDRILRVGDDGWNYPDQTWGFYSSRPGFDLISHIKDMRDFGAFATMYLDSSECTNSIRAKIALYTVMSSGIFIDNFRNYQFNMPATQDALENWRNCAKEYNKFASGKCSSLTYLVSEEYVNDEGDYDYRYKVVAI